MCKLFFCIIFMQFKLAILSIATKHCSSSTCLKKDKIGLSFLKDLIQFPYYFVYIFKNTCKVSIKSRILLFNKKRSNKSLKT